MLLFALRTDLFHKRIILRIYVRNIFRLFDDERDAVGAVVQPFLFFGGGRTVQRGRKVYIKALQIKHDRGVSVFAEFAYRIAVRGFRRRTVTGPERLHQFRFDRFRIAHAAFPRIDITLIRRPFFAVKDARRIQFPKPCKRTVHIARAADFFGNNRKGFFVPRDALKICGRFFFARKLNDKRKEIVDGNAFRRTRSIPLPRGFRRRTFYRFGGGFFCRCRLRCRSFDTRQKFGRG